jgi:hypothetical protein
MPGHAVRFRLRCMLVHVDDPVEQEALARWLSDRGWSVAEDLDEGLEVLLGWDEDEFAAALRLRADVAAWRVSHETAEVAVDRHVWATAPRAA